MAHLAGQPVMLSSSSAGFVGILMLSLKQSPLLMMPLPWLWRIAGMG